MSFKLFWLCAFSLFLPWLCKSTAGETYDNETAIIDEIKYILAQPNDQVDLGYSRFLIESLLYPHINIEENLQKLDEIVFTIQHMPEFGSSPEEKLGTTLRYLYTPGHWNNYHAYHYDLNDPFGTKLPKNKSVAHYLKTKKGNCVSMPLLLVILAERLGVRVHLSLAPLHIFVRYTDAGGLVTNIETTSGTLLTDQQYVDAFSIPQEALDHNIYLQNLTKRQAIAAMLIEVGRQQLHTGHYNKGHDLADFILQQYPKLVDAQLLKGSLYAQQLNSELNIAQRPLNTKTRAHLDSLLLQNLAWFEKAESLGWREPPPNFDEQYARSIERFKIQHR